MLISYLREDGEELFQDGNFLELPLLQRGLLWGVGTLCKEYPEEMIERGIENDLHSYLGSTDREVCKLALWSLAHLDSNLTCDIPLGIVSPKDTIRVYAEGTFTEIHLQDILKKLNTN